MKKIIDVKILAKEYNLRIIGDKTRCVVHPGSLSRQNKEFIYWLKNPQYIHRIPKGVIIVSEEDILKIEIDESIVYLVTNEKPRLIYAKILQKYFSYLGLKLNKNHVATHKLNKKIFISENVFIGEDVSIGDGTIIHPNVVIYNNTRIGKNCVIRANSSIGTEGVGFEKDHDDNWIKFPQLGGVTMGNNVEVGPSSTIRRGALDDTIVEDQVKIGSLCNIGHNCVVGAKSLLTSQCVMAGSSSLGENVFMGTQSVLRNGVSIEANVVIGAGAVVVKSVKEPNVTMIGSPAIKVDEYRAWSSIKTDLINNSELNEE